MMEKPPSCGLHGVATRMQSSDSWEQGATVDERDRKGRTALMWAAGLQYAERGETPVGKTALIPTQSLTTGLPLSCGLHAKDVSTLLRC